MDGDHTHRPPPILTNVDPPTVPPTVRDTVLAGHRGDIATALAGWRSDDPAVRSAALGALDRCDAFGAEIAAAATHDPSVAVRRRAAELAARHVEVDLGLLLADDDATVVEVAAWACGEREGVPDPLLHRLIELATGHDELLVREAAVAALGAIGDERGLPAILAGCRDKPAVRRRAVLALAPFEGPEVDAALQRALTDRDWQVRQGAEDLLDPTR
jgi:HEAT repeat protein